jgi:hypothetical protein
MKSRGGWVSLGIVAVVAASWMVRMSLFPAATPGSRPGAAAPATAVVTRQDLTATTPETATLGYAQVYAVTGQGSGTLTWLPSPGQLIGQGQVLYKTGDGTPVVLLYGTVPDWRALGEGMTGQDVSQLNHDLVGMGWADRSDVVLLGWDYYSWETAYAVQQMEDHLGVAWPPGSLSLGQVVFEPEALRVAQVTGSLGGSADGPVLTATSGRQVVTIALDASQQTEVRAGDAVSIALPDGSTTPGVISSVGTVATTSSSAPGQGEGPAATTIAVTVTLVHPQAAGTLDQAPVTVNITTETSPGPVLAVPVTALLAQSSGGYDVEVAGPGSARRYVPVTPGIYDDAAGLVQVTGALTAGERVVVAAS